MTPCRIFIIDDEVLVRQGLSARFSKYDDLRVAGVSSNFQNALVKLEATPADFLLLDLDIEGSDPADCLREIRQKFPDLLVLSITPSEFLARKLPEDLIVIGRSEFIVRPRLTTTMEAFLDDLAQQARKRAMAMYQSMLRTRPKSPQGIAEDTKSSLRLAQETPSSIAQAPVQKVSDSKFFSASDSTLQAEKSATSRRKIRSPKRVDMLVIASSTGGPNALAEVIPRLPGDLPVPVLIVQHMPPEFTRSLADRLDSLSPLKVKEAARGDIPLPGLVLIAPGDFHMTVESDRESYLKIRLNQDAPENSCRPAADVLFRSAAKLYGENLLGVVLTGMGKDGLAGSVNIVDAGGNVIAQDEKSSVVWGMPGEIARADLADAILPLNEIADEIVKRVRAFR